jgi:hypothetical protein
VTQQEVSESLASGWYRDVTQLPLLMETARVRRRRMAVSPRELMTRNTLGVGERMALHERAVVEVSTRRAPQVHVRLLDLCLRHSAGHGEHPPAWAARPGPGAHRDVPGNFQKALDFISPEIGELMRTCGQREVSAHQRESSSVSGSSGLSTRCATSSSGAGGSAWGSLRPSCRC